MRKAIVLFVTLAMILCVMPAAATAEGGEPIVITAFVAGDPEIDYTQNYIIKMLEEKTGVRLDVSKYLVSSAEAATQKQLLLAGGDYPDIFLCEFSFSELISYGMKDGILVPLNEYLIDNLSDYPTFEMLYTERPQYLNMFIASDGNVYGIPHFSECGHCRATNKTYINMDWLNKLGLDVPETLDEFRAVLEAFRDNDMNENGVQDEIPLSSYESKFASYIINAFIPTEVAMGKYTHIIDGKVGFSADKDEFQEALAYMRQMFVDGLIDEAAFTQTSSQMSQVVSGEMPMVGAFSVEGAIYQVDMNNEYVYQNYRLMMPLTGPQGVKGTDNRPISDMNSGASFVMTDACKNPEAAMRMMNTLCSFDTYMNRVYGLEGEGWVYAEEGQTNVLGGEYRYQFLDATVGGSSDKATENVIFHGGPWGALMQFRAMWSNRWEDEVLYSNPAYFESRIELETETLSEFFIESAPSTFLLSAEETTEYTELRTNISGYVSMSVAQFITGARDLDTEWDSYLNDLSRYNVDRFLELYQIGYDKMIGA